MNAARRSQLRAIFLGHRKSYTPTGAAKILGIERQDVLAMIEAFAIDAERHETTTYRLPWSTIASLTLRGLRLADIIEALGDQAADVLPRLWFPSPEPLSVTLPLYLSRFLEHLAATQAMTLDECLASIVHGYAEGLIQPTPQQIEEAIPGFERALAFPDEPETLP
jgi:hypothetical protein